MNLRTMSPMPIRALLVAALCLASTGTASAAPQQEMILGAEGQVYSVRVGDRAALFGVEQPEAESVLALDVQWPDGSQQRLLVPGTDGGEPENHPFLLLDSETQTLYLLWESVLNKLHPIVNLITFRDNTWGEKVEIVYNPFVSKTAPRMLVQHDEIHQFDETGASVTKRRTVIHVVWSELEGDAQYATYYVPVLIDDGVTLHSTPVRLNDLVPPSELPAGFAPDAAPLVEMLEGRDDRRTLVSFPSDGGARLAVVELDLLPGDLSRLADEARGHIIDIGARHTPLSPDAIRSIAEEARGHIIDIGVAYHPEVIRAIADEARGHIIDIGVHGDVGATPDIRSIAEGARGHIIDIGSKLTERGLRRVHGAQQSRLLEIGSTEEAAATSPVLIRVKAIATYERPDLGGAPSHLFLSSSGEDAVLARTEEGRVVYRQLRGTEWSPVHELKLGSGLDLEAALGVLKARVGRD